MENPEKQVPRSWVGSEVLLARTDAPDSELVALVATNEFGLAYTYSTGELQDVPVFVPWSAISWMRPSIPRDLERIQPDDEGQEG